MANILATILRTSLDLWEYTLQILDKAIYLEGRLKKLLLLSNMALKVDITTRKGNKKTTFWPCRNIKRKLKRRRIFYQGYSKIDEALSFSHERKKCGNRYKNLRPCHKITISNYFCAKRNFYSHSIKILGMLDHN